MRQMIITISILVTSSCASEHNIFGTYRLHDFPKTTLKINSDQTFEFVKNNPNPYLHPFDHPGENYFITRGTWTKSDNKTISITSQKDTLVYPLADVNKSLAKEANLSHFVFYDLSGDTVRLLYTILSNGGWVGRLHGTSPFFSTDLTKSDTFEFHFYGYRPFKFMSRQKINQDYSIRLKPEFQPGFFDSTEFRIKRNRLIDIKRHGKFKKVKGGI